uniref:Uncharacterized protein n=1 Tax=Arundo donax TaxID=35708 RepID=A0A0A9AGV3_ARUDO
MVSWWPAKILRLLNKTVVSWAHPFM